MSNEICCEPKKRDPEPPYARVELVEEIAVPKLNEEVTLMVKGKLVFVEMGKRYSGESEWTKSKGELKIEISSIKIAGKNIFAEMAEDE